MKTIYEATIKEIKRLSINEDWSLQLVAKSTYRSRSMWVSIPSQETEGWTTGKRVRVTVEEIE